MPRRLGLLLACSLAVGCASARSLAPRPAAAPSGDWPAATRLLDGFDLAAPGDPWRIGDRVLLGVRTERGGRITVRYVLVELVEGTDLKTRLSFDGTVGDGGRRVVLVSPPSRLTRLTVFDEEGRRLVESRGAIPDKLLNNGLTGLLGLTQTNRPSTLPATTLRDQAIDRAMLGMMTLVQFGASSGGNEALASMTREVIDTPSLWSLLTRRPTLGLDTSDVRAGRVDFAGEDRPSAEVSVEASFNDERVLNLRAIAVENRPPIGLASGIVRADGQHPTDPARRLRLEVLAARRGSGRSFKAYTIAQ